MKYSTVHELVTGPKASLACASIDAGSLRASIVTIIDGLRRVANTSHKPTAKVLADYFGGCLNEADRLIEVPAYHADLKRIALALSLVTLGDL